MVLTIVDFHYTQSCISKTIRKLLVPPLLSCQLCWPHRVELSRTHNRFHGIEAWKILSLPLETFSKNSRGGGETKKADEKWDNKVVFVYLKTPAQLNFHFVWDDSSLMKNWQLCQESRLSNSVKNHHELVMRFWQLLFTQHHHFSKVCTVENEPFLFYAIYHFHFGHYFSTVDEFCLCWSSHYADWIFRFMNSKLAKLK